MLNTEEAAGDGKRCPKRRFGSILAIILSVLLAGVFAWAFFSPGSGCAGVARGMNALVAAFWGSVVGTVLTGWDIRRAGLRNPLTCLALILNVALAAWTAFVFLDLVF
jgi:hypothetical protein